MNGVGDIVVLHQKEQESHLMLEWWDAITCIGEACKTNAYWTGSAVVQIIIIGIIPASIYLVYRKYKKKKHKKDNKNNVP